MKKHSLWMMALAAACIAADRVHAEEGKRWKNTVGTAITSPKLPTDMTHQPARNKSAIPRPNAIKDDTKTSVAFVVNY